MLYNSGPQTLVCIVEVSVIGESILRGSTVLTMHTSVVITACSDSLHLHLSNSKGVAESLPCGPHHTIPKASCCWVHSSIVVSIKVWLEAVIMPPGTLRFICTMNRTRWIIVLISCTKPPSIMVNKTVPCSSTVSWYWQSVLGWWISYTETCILCIGWVSFKISQIDS